MLNNYDVEGSGAYDDDDDDAVNEMMISLS